jgi:hypothetical protein
MNALNFGEHLSQVLGHGFTRMNADLREISPLDLWLLLASCQPRCHGCDVVRGIWMR